MGPNSTIYGFHLPIRDTKYIYKLLPWESIPVRRFLRYNQIPHVPMSSYNVLLFRRTSHNFLMTPESKKLYIGNLQNIGLVAPVFTKNLKSHIGLKGDLVSKNSQWFLMISSILCHTFSVHTPLLRWAMRYFSSPVSKWVMSTGYL